MPLIEITAPAAEPVTAAEVKAAAKIDGTEFDTQITIAIAALRALAEQKLGRRLITQTCEIVLDEFPSAEIDLQLPDVQSIASVKYLEATAGTETTLASDQYSLDSDSIPCWLLPAYDTDWPDTYDTVNAVRVRFTVGYGAASTDVPQEIRLWIIAHATQMINRSSGEKPKEYEPMLFIDRLLDRHTCMRMHVK